MQVLGYVWRKDAKRWSYAPADPDTGRPPEYTPALPTAPTRAAALERLLSRPGPLWADPTSQTLHTPGHTDTPAPAPGPGAVVDMTERIGPGWALHREGEADAHTWLVTYEGQVRGMVRRYRPRSGGLSRGWEALAGAGGSGAWDGVLPAQTRVVEWPPHQDAPTDYWLTSLPADTALRYLVRVAKIRWRIEHDYRELKHGLGLAHYEGRTWRGWHHHVTLVSAAQAFLTLRRLDPKAGTSI